MISTQIIILAKHPYRESALLLSGISPDYGKLDLMVHGAQKLSAREFPEADLFRELEVDFEESSKSELQNPKSMIMVSDFGNIAENPKAFMMAGKIGKFLLDNSTADSPLPLTYDTLKSVFTQLATPAPEWTLEQCAVVMKTVFLYENGLLPEAQSQKENDFLENLIAAGIENSLLPGCAQGYWRSLNQWLDSLISFHQLKK